MLDKMNTKTLDPLYQTFPTEEAYRLMSKLEQVFAPKHGSLLNMAEPELSVMTRQRFSDRVGTQDEVERRIAACQKDRTNAKLASTGDSQPTTPERN